MQITLKSNFIQFAERIGAARKQVPFAVANTLTDIAFMAREEIVQKTYPRSFNVKNKRFAGVVFRVDKANKRTLTASIYDRIARAGGKGSVYLARHESGGIKTSRSSTNVAIPGRKVKNYIRGASGQVKAQYKPKALLMQPNFFKIKLKKTGLTAIAGREVNAAKYKASLTSQSPSAVGGGFAKIAKRGEKGQFKVYYILKPQAYIKKTFPYYDAIKKVAHANLQRSFTKNLAKAMATRK